jgi:hypothetical protein
VTKRVHALVLNGIVMSTYEFTVIVSHAPELTDELADKLFAAGCDDGSPGTSDGVFSIDFHREATSLEAAIRSAIGNVVAAGLSVERVEIRAGALPASA